MLRGRGRLRLLAALALAFCGSIQAGEVTVIRPKPFIAAEDTYYVLLDGQRPLDIGSREHVRFSAAPGKHILSIQCPKAYSRTYAETRLEHDFGTAPEFFVIEPKFDCVTIAPVDARTASGLIGSSTLHAADARGTYEAGGTVLAAAAIETRETDVAPKDEVAAATAAWVDVFNSGDPARIASLYDPEGVLIGTSAKQPVMGTAAITAYFRQTTGEATARVALGEHRTRVYGDVAIDSGLYNVFLVRDGKPVLVPSRYTFVYRKRDGKWLIVEHHSSRVP